MEVKSPSLFLKTCNILLAITCYSPIGWLVAFYSYVVRVTIELGHIPRYSGYGTDDITLSETHEYISDLMLAVAFYSPLLVLILAIITRSLKSRFRTVNLIVYGVAIFFSLVTLTGPFFEWYVD